MMGVVGEGDSFFDENTIKNALTKAFHKFDTDNSGWLGFTEFARAWGELGQGNAEYKSCATTFKLTNSTRMEVENLENGSSHKRGYFWD